MTGPVVVSADCRAAESAPTLSCLRARLGGAPRVELDASLEQISALGAHLELGVPLQAGTRVFTVVKLPAGARVAARGVVVRVELRPDGLFGLAIQFTRARLLVSPDEVTTVTGAPAGNGITGLGGGERGRSRASSGGGPPVRATGPDY